MKVLVSGLLIAGLQLAFIALPARAVSLNDVVKLLESARALEGSPKHVEPLEGRTVVVTFFASWCPPCRDEFRHLNKLSALASGSQVTIVGINQFEAWGGKKNPARMARFLSDTKPEFALIEGSEAMRQAFGNIERIPSVIVFGRNGNELWRFVHERGSNKTHAELDELVDVLRKNGVDVRSP